MKKIILVLTLLILAGCATGPTTPPESPISIQLKGTAVEVQNFIEQNISNTHGKRAKDLRITNADNRSITFQTDCMKVESYGAVSCTLIKMQMNVLLLKDAKERLIRFYSNNIYYHLPLRILKVSIVNIITVTSMDTVMRIILMQNYAEM